MAGWRRCDNCRKVRQVEEYDGDAPTCTVCLTAPAPKRRAAAPVTRKVAPVSASPAPAAAPRMPRMPRNGPVGTGDLEVRERRARRTAHEQLAELHADDFEVLLQQARKAEGLRT